MAKTEHEEDEKKCQEKNETKYQKPSKSSGVKSTVYLQRSLTRLH